MTFQVYKLTPLQKGIVYGGEPLQVIQITLPVFNFKCIVSIIKANPVNPTATFLNKFGTF